MPSIRIVRRDPTTGMFQYWSRRLSVYYCDNDAGIVKAVTNTHPIHARVKMRMHMSHTKHKMYVDWQIQYYDLACMSAKPADIMTAYRNSVATAAANTPCDMAGNTAAPR